ncbi:MAG: hypothetical protein ACHQ5A_08455, partial [Opitutales bacterium]
TVLTTFLGHGDRWTEFALTIRPVQFSGSTSSERKYGRGLGDLSRSRNRYLNLSLSSGLMMSVPAKGSLIQSHKLSRLSF